MSHCLLSETQKEMRENLSKVRRGGVLIVKFPFASSCGDNYNILDFSSLFIPVKMVTTRNREGDPSRDTDSNKNYIATLPHSVLCPNLKKGRDAF